MKNRNSSVNNMIMTAMMMCMVVVMTMIIRIPIPATQGYIHLGDCMIFFSVLLLGWKRGAVAAGIGSAMADLLAGYSYYAPVTFVVKGLMAVIMGFVLEFAIRKNFSSGMMKFAEGLAMTVSGIFMAAGYYVAESVMYGSWVTPLAAVPMNIIQFAVGVAIAMVLAHALGKTPAGRIFVYDVALLEK